MTPILKYNLHLIVFFYSLMFLAFGQQLGLPDFLAPVLFILMIFGFIVSAVVGERFKKGISPQLILISKMAWTLFYVLIVIIGGLVFDTIANSTVQTVMMLAAMYLAYGLWKLRKTKLETS